LHRVGLVAIAEITIGRARSRARGGARSASPGRRRGHSRTIRIGIIALGCSKTA
jgi:hypothetical protein